MNTTDTTEVTAEMIEAGEKAYRTGVLRNKRAQDWLAEVPNDEPPEVRRSIAAALHRRAAWLDEQANAEFRRLCPSAELRRELLDMIKLEQS